MGHLIKPKETNETPEGGSRSIVSRERFPGWGRNGPPLFLSGLLRKLPGYWMASRPRESLGLWMTNTRRAGTYVWVDSSGKSAQKGWSSLEMEAEMSIEGYKDEKNPPRS